ncbi:MAG: hypothetical protein M1436_03675 [Acidobacteria bacterium]|nr:hypothetical protein [Acidobacteriota bacterium]
MSRQFLSALGVLLCLGQSMLWGEDRIQLTWGELAPRILERKVALVLPDGKHIKGKVQGVWPDSLRLRVGRRDRSIPRESVSVLRLTEYGTRGRWLAVAGTLGAASVVTAAKYPDLYEGPAVAIVPAVVAGGMAGLAAASYFIGKRLDKHTIEIRVIRKP